MKNIIVFFGGKSYEHDVSIITGLQVINNLNKFLYNIIPIYISKVGDWWTGDELLKIEFYKNINYKKLKKVFVIPNDSNLYQTKNNKKKVLLRIDCAVCATHGGNGEDGTLSGILENSNIAKTCASLSSSAVAMDKYLTKCVLKQNKISTLDAEVIFGLNDKTIKNINFPAIIKPSKLGSSIGIKVCKNIEELNDAIKLGLLLDEKVIVEQALTNFAEYNIALFKFDNKIKLSQIERPQKIGDILSFENKYLETNTAINLREFPAIIDIKLKNKIENYAKKSYKALGLNGVVRIDFLFDLSNKKLYVNEINTIPGSLSFYLFKNELDFCVLLDCLIKQAIIDNQNQKKELIFNSNILDSYQKNISGTKKLSKI